MHCKAIKTIDSSFGPLPDITDNVVKFIMFKAIYRTRGSVVGQRDIPWYFLPVGGIGWNIFS